MEKRILIVDDEITTLLAYKKLFQKPGIEVDTAETLEEAKNLMGRENYHVIITDLQLNGENKEGGFEILRCVNKDYPETKAILLTAHGNHVLKEKARSLGASFYFEKPVPILSLKAVLSIFGIE